MHAQRRPSPPTAPRQTSLPSKRTEPPPMTLTPDSNAFPIQEIPFSRYGSWFDISPVVAQHVQADDLHLVSHQNGIHPVLRLTPTLHESGERAPTTWRATPTRLTW